MKTLEFEPSTLPWIDRDDFEGTLAGRQKSGLVDTELAQSLGRWRDDGFLVCRGLVPTEMLDALLEDVERVWRDRPELQALVEGRGVVDLDQLPARAEIGNHHYRLLDLQDASGPARDVILSTGILRFIGAVFGDVPVAMQSLYFEYGSEQGTHQDFPYVHARVPSHLIGCWVACEPVDETSGPLFYYPGSHRLPKFDWGNGELLFDNEDPAKNDAFQAYLEEACERAGLEKVAFHPEKGDVVFWHAALVHGGSPALDSERTRRSLVVHYSSRSGYPRDRRSPHQPPKIYEQNGGRLYLRQKQAATGKIRGKVQAVLRRLRGS
ncbi:MAG: phytanoyl-CoA dioxygenase family protein [Acidobacteriota bacterium]